MLELYRISSGWNLFLIMFGCFGVLLHAIASSLCFMRSGLRKLDGCREVSLAIQMLFMVVMLATARRLTSDGTIIQTAFDRYLYLSGGLAMLFCAVSLTLASTSAGISAMLLTALTLPCFARFTHGWYAEVFGLTLVLMTLRAVLILRANILELTTGVTRASVKRALDALPDGLLFARMNGSVMMQNHSMMTLSYRLTGAFTTDANQFWKSITGNKLTAREILPLDDGRILVREESGRSWELSREWVDLRGESAIQILAVDVSETDRIVKELSRTNESLRATAHELKQTLTRNREILIAHEAVSVKMRLHDCLGQRVSLILRAIEDNTRESRSEALSLLDKLPEDLNSGKADTSQAFHDIAQAFRYIGTNVTLDGMLPEEGVLRDTLLSILREAATNAVRHAGAKNVRAKIAYADGRTTLSIENDGRTPDQQITEGNGIGGMRERLRELGGTLVIQTEPRFLLTAIVEGGHAK